MDSSSAKAEATENGGVDSRQDPGDIETYAFTHSGEQKVPLLYCCGEPKPHWDPTEIEVSLKLLEETDIEARFRQVFPKKLEEETKSQRRDDGKSPDLGTAEKGLRLEGVKAAIKTTLKCQKDCGFERMQGFASNIQPLAREMGRFNTVTHILPKIPLLLASSRV